MKILAFKECAKIGTKKVHFVLFKTTLFVRQLRDNKKLREVSPVALNLVEVKPMTKTFVILHLLTLMFLRLENVCGSCGGFAAAATSRILV